MDAVEDLGHVLVDVLHDDAEDSIPLLFEPCVSGLIARPLFVVIVRWTVDFDDEPRRWAVEVHEIGTDGLLSTKLPSVHLSAL